MPSKSKYILKWVMTPKALRRIADWFYAHAEEYQRHSKTWGLMREASSTLHRLAKALEDEEDGQGPRPKKPAVAHDQSERRHTTPRKDGDKAHDRPRPRRRRGRRKAVWT